MKITVINGTEKHGVTYRLKEIFLQNFQGADIVEFYLPKDCPSFCVGCTNCFVKGENICKDYSSVNAIEKSLLEADLIVMTSPETGLLVNLRRSTTQSLSTRSLLQKSNL